MTDEVLWFEPVELLPRCSLNEGLLWIWAQRVPVSDIYREKNAFETLQDWECENLKIPPVPEGIRHGAHYRTEERLRHKNFGRVSADNRELLVANALAEAAAVKEWLPSVARMMERPATRLFVELCSGKLEAKGKLLPKGAEIIDFLEDQNSYSGGEFDDLKDRSIPNDLWTMSGIDWLSNAITAQGKCYCDVSLSTEALMDLFPGERTPILDAEFVGDLVRVKKIEGENAFLHRRTAGRPSKFAWDAFHVEVAGLIASGKLPQKKEAAIQIMLGWFESTQKQDPSRSAVSEKLTPYYRRFFAKD